LSNGTELSNSISLLGFLDISSDSLNLTLLRYP
jgi:hypothetical protein